MVGATVEVVVTTAFGGFFDGGGRRRCVHDVVDGEREAARVADFVGRGDLDEVAAELQRDVSTPHAVCVGERLDAGDLTMCPGLGEPAHQQVVDAHLDAVVQALVERERWRAWCPEGS